MKKWVKKLLCLLCAATTVFSVLGFSACNQTVITAYDIAVKNGFTGTEEEWLLSLKGQAGKDGEDGKDGALTFEDLYQAALDAGFVGSELEFIQSLGIDYSANNDTKTIAKNVTSVVSIFCGFETTTRGYMGSKVEITSAGGSGVIIDLDKESGSAYVVTNYHVIYDHTTDGDGISDEIYLYPYGGLVGFDVAKGKDETGYGIKATFVGGAMDYDIALLEVKGSQVLKNSHLSQAEFGDSNKVRVGEKTFAIGNSNGLGISVTSGIVSVDSETIVMSSFDGAEREVAFRVIRTDAAVNHGNSGGGLFDIDGKLIGITNAKNVEDETDNICYAIPSTLVKYLIDNVKDHIKAGKTGYVNRAMVGITTTLSNTSVYLDENGELAVKETFYILDVTKGSIAEKAGLEVMDVITDITIDGVTTKLNRRYYLNDLLLTVRKGDSVTLTVLRDSVDGAGKDKLQITLIYDEDSYFVKYN